MERYIADQNIRRYLLGELVEAEQQRLEESLLVSSELFEELLIAEDELVDEYLNGQLTDSERERFEKHFLSTPARLEKLKFARAFKKHITTAASRESPVRAAAEAHPSFWKRWFPAFLRTPNPVLSRSLAMAALLLIVVAGLLVITRTDRAPEITANRGPSSSNLFAITLMPGVVRDAGEMKRVVIPADAEAVELRLELTADEYPSYRAVLQTDEGREIFRADKLKAEGIDGKRSVVVNVPARLLVVGDYQLRLGGLAPGGEFEDIARYPFRVLSR